MTDQAYRYTASALEGIARSTLKRYDERLITGGPAAVPIEKIAEWLGLTVLYLCLRKNGLILGETAFDDTFIPVYDREGRRYDFTPVSRGTVLINDSLLQDKTDGRLRFTVAHEVAHWLIHQDVFTGSRETAALLNPAKSSDADSLTERQANILATSLLLPAGQVKKAFYSLRGRGDIPVELARLFGVSLQAIGIFLRDHRLA
jgi:hypothetical protein